MLRARPGAARSALGAAGDLWAGDAGRPLGTGGGARFGRRRARDRRDADGLAGGHSAQVAGAVAPPALSLPNCQPARRARVWGAHPGRRDLRCGSCEALLRPVKLSPASVRALFDWIGCLTRAVDPPASSWRWRHSLALVAEAARRSRKDAYQHAIRPKRGFGASRATFG